MRLNPYYPSWYPQHLGIALYCLERYEDAVKMHERTLRVNPNASTWWLAATCAQLNKDHIPGWMLAATYGLLDRQEKAERALADHLKEHRLRKYTIERVMNTYLYAFKDPGVKQKFNEGLQKAGLPTEKETNSGE